MATTKEERETGAIVQRTVQRTRDTGAAPHAASDFEVAPCVDADTPIPFSVPADAWPIPYALTERA